jgi:tripartite ATP-independent transporter DctM subunit
MIFILVIIFIVLMIVGMPISFALGVATLGAVVLLGYDPVVFFHRMLNSISSFSLIAVPLYVLAGNLCSETGITKRLVKMCTSFVGHIPGGTGLVNVLASIFFGGISGSAVADTSAIGGMLIPVMEEEGYDKEFAGGITMASSTIGILIPPSIPQCLYGVCTGVSIGAMFMAGVIPGVLVGLFQMALCFIISRRRGYPCHKKATVKERLYAMKEAVWALGMPLIILVGCGAGVVTASEAGVIAVVYSILIGVFIYKELDIRKLPTLFINSIVTASVALYIVGIASVVSWVINVENIPQQMIYFLNHSVNNQVLILLIVNLILFLCGCFMDLVPIMLLFAPIFLPVVQECGISAIQFGIIMSINLGIGLLTPPVGNCLFIASGIAETSTAKLFKASLPFVCCNVFCLLLVHIVPSLTTFLPTIFGY